MVFTILCSRDGAVEVGLDDITSIIVSEDDNVRVLFTCPICGDDVAVEAQVPHVMLAALQDMYAPLEEQGSDGARVLRFGSVSVATAHVPAPAAGPTPEDSERIERYVEYFRRQLEAAASADAVIAEIDAGES